MEKVEGGQLAIGNIAMKKLTCHPFFLLALNLILGGLFLYAGILKAQNPQAFSDNIFSFQILPNALVNGLALGLPPFEIITGGMLIVGWQRRTAALGLLVLTCIFTFALSQALARGLKVDCGCFGSGTPSAVKNWLSLGRDILLIAMGAWLYCKWSKPETDSPAGQTRPSGV
jgi:putative oxidoreductase